MRVVVVLLFLCIGFTTSGCGASITTAFPNSLIGSDGQPLVLDDLEAIANDPDLSADEKRQAFRDLGILDEELIDALLDL